MSVIRFLEELGRADLRLAGGKGANLGELVRAGFPVPGGFVVTTDAYRHCVSPPDLGGLDVRDVIALEATSARIGAAIEAATLPEEVAAEVVEAYRRLGSPPVAARSSATAEDLPGASFAEQQERFLDVQGEHELLRAMRRCWASLWTARAIRYRAERGYDSETVALAVVVQAMAPHDVAGVGFTVNPVSGSADELLVNAVRGVGEMLVRGEARPDQWIARRPDGAVLSPRAGAGARARSSPAPPRPAA